MRLDRVAVGAEHHAALQDRRRVVEVHDRLRRARARLEGPLDQLGPALGQHLDGHVVGDRALLDDLADEVEVGLAGRREADLDLLVAHADQQVEHAALAGRAHRVDQGLVAVPQVDRAPHRGRLDDLVRPGAVGQGDRLDLFGERPVPVHGHRRGALGVPRGLAGVGCTRGGGDRAYRREGVDGMGVAGLFTVLLRIRLVGIQTGASRTPATGSQSGSDPVAASEEEHPLHADTVLRRAARPKPG